MEAKKKTLKGVVVSNSTDQSIVVLISYRKTQAKFKKFINRSKRIMAHDAENKAKVGDVVNIISSRPYSKLKRYELGEILEPAAQ